MQTASFYSFMACCSEQKAAILVTVPVAWQGTMRDNIASSLSGLGFKIQIQTVRSFILECCPARQFPACIASPCRACSSQSGQSKRAALRACSEDKLGHQNPMDLVELNVGGQGFVTTLGTLAKEPENLLARMFCRDLTPSVRDKEGRYES